MGVIISAFPGTGKSYAASLGKFSALDLDSSSFSREGGEWHKAYVDRIKDEIDDHAFIFCSSHENVRKEMDERGISYALVYPRMDLKEEYIKRYRERGSSEELIDKISSNWEKFIGDIQKEEKANVIKFELGSGEFLSPAIIKISLWLMFQLPVVPPDEHFWAIGMPSPRDIIGEGSRKPPIKIYVPKHVANDYPEYFIDNKGEKDE